jgi:hypothetical protein
LPFRRRAGLVDLLLGLFLAEARGVLLALDLGAHLGGLLHGHRTPRTGRAVAIALRPDKREGDHGQADERHERHEDAIGHGLPIARRPGERRARA